MPRIPVGADDGSKNETLPSTRKRKDGTYIDSQTKQKAVRPTLPRFNEGQITWNCRPISEAAWKPTEPSSIRCG